VNAKQRMSVAGMIIGIGAGIISSVLVVGREARLVDVLTVFFSGFAGGASFVALIRSGSKKARVEPAARKGI
jgi:hypothetical protein